MTGSCQPGTLVPSSMKWVLRSQLRLKPKHDFPLSKPNSNLEVPSASVTLVM